MHTIVLVHGAWHGGWCYRDVARLLRAQGHEVFIPTLTGLGERSHLRNLPVNLSTHIEDVVNLCLWEDLRDVVLVGHSYGGIVVTGAADRIADRVARLVYLDAFVPQDGDSLATMIGEEGLKFLRTLLTPDGLSFRPFSAEAWGVVDDKRAWVDGKCCNHPVATMFEPIRLDGAFGDKPRRYVLATGSGSSERSAFTRFYDRFQSDPAWDVRSIASGHDMMVDMPEETARVIIG